MGILSRAESFIKIKGHEKKTTLWLDFHAIRTQHGHPFTPVDSSKSCFFYFLGSAESRMSFLQLNNYVFQLWGVTPPRCFCIKPCF